MKLEKYKEQKGGKGTEVASGPKTSPEGQRSTKQNGAFEIDDKQEGNHEIKGSARKEEAENEGQLYTILLPHKE